MKVDHHVWICLSLTLNILFLLISLKKSSLKNDFYSFFKQMKHAQLPRMLFIAADYLLMTMARSIGWKLDVCRSHY